MNQTTDTKKPEPKIDKASIMGGVTPYLRLGGDAGEAIALYEKAFGAVLVDDPARGQDGKTLNATLMINDGAFMAMEHMKGPGATPAQSGQRLILQLVVADGDMCWSRAIGAGCEATDPFETKFWGDRFGRLRDPFVPEWVIHEPSPEQQGMSAAERAAKGAGA